MMRLIDADALINDIKNDAEKTINEGDIVGSFWLGYITGLVDIQPTAQPKTRTGKWMLGFDNRYMEKYYYCSCCGGRKYEESKPLDCYCSKCGADMRTKEMDCDYEKAVEQLEYDMLYEPTFNQDDGSM